MSETPKCDEVARHYMYTTEYPLREWVQLARTFETELATVQAALSAAEQRATVAEGMARDAKRIHAALTVADECGLITDTLWMLEGNETVFDAVAALASGEPK